MKSILLVACLAACGTNDPGPHDVVACAAEWSEQAYGGQLNVAKDGCERACEIPPSNYLTGGPSCTLGSGAPLDHCDFFTLADGTTGCCLIASGYEKRPITFFECDPQP